MRRIELAASLAVLFLSVAAMPAVASPTFTTLQSFDATNGDSPDASLIQGTDGLLYGTGIGGGANNDGLVFSIDTGGTTLSPVLSLAGASSPFGSFPQGVIQGTDGNLYGVASFSGAHGQGSVFKVAPNGAGYTDLYDFGATAGDAEQPYGGLVQGSDGSFYGVTFAGGANGDGTIFKISSLGGSITILHSFGAWSGDLSLPEASMIEDQDGSLFGTTDGGGTYGLGGVFRINLDGSGYAIIHSFATVANDGVNSFSPLIEGGDGFLYGTTFGGGANSTGIVFKIAPDGSGYQVLHSFASNATDGGFPQAGLALGNDENLYGAAEDGGPNGASPFDGSLYEISRDGATYNTLYFFAGADGKNPSGGLLQATNGTLYGTTINGGASGDGAIFSLDNGLSASPTGLYVRSSDDIVMLYWTPDTLGTTYNLYRSTTPGGEGSTPYQTGLTSPHYFDEGVTQSTQYYYQVTSVNSGVESAKSYEVTGTPMMAIANTNGLSVSPGADTGGAPTTGTLTLQQATTGPTTAFVSSDNPNVTISNPDVTVPANQASTTFTVNTTYTGSPYTATITASENGTDASTTITVNAPPVLHTFSAGLQMISAPTDDTGQRLSDIFGSGAAKLAAWNGSGYVVSPAAPADTIVPAKGYWYKPTSSSSLYDIGTDTSTANTYQITLSVGWNIIGDPFTINVPAADLQVQNGSNPAVSFSAANLAGLVGGTFYTYQPGDSAYEVLPASSSTLTAYEGYWLYAFAPCTLIFPAGG